MSHGGDESVSPRPPFSPLLIGKGGGREDEKEMAHKSWGRSRGKDLARDSSFSQQFDKQTSGNQRKPKHLLFNLANLSLPSSPTPFSPKFFCANTAARVEATAKEARVGQKLTKDLSPHQSPLPPPFSPSPSCAPPLPLRALIMQPTLASCFSPLQELFSRRRKGGIRVCTVGGKEERDWSKVYRSVFPFSSSSTLPHKEPLPPCCHAFA